MDHEAYKDANTIVNRLHQRNNWIKLKIPMEAEIKHIRCLQQ